MIIFHVFLIILQIVPRIDCTKSLYEYISAFCRLCLYTLNIQWPSLTIWIVLNVPEYCQPYIIPVIVRIDLNLVIVRIDVNLVIVRIDLNLVIVRIDLNLVTMRIDLNLGNLVMLWIEPVILWIVTC